MVQSTRAEELGLTSCWRECADCSPGATGITRVTRRATDRRVPHRARRALQDQLIRDAAGVHTEKGGSLPVPVVHRASAVAGAAVDAMRVGGRILNQSMLFAVIMFGRPWRPSRNRVSHQAHSRE